MNELWTVVDFVLTIAQWVIIIQAILSWLVAFNVVNTYNGGVRSIWQALERVTEPVYRPIRRVLPDFGGLDLSPMVVLLVIILLRRLVAVQMVQSYMIQ
jgi:YggT family protein